MGCPNISYLVSFPMEEALKSSVQQAFPPNMQAAYVLHILDNN
jgi:hypothetical protein